MYSDIDNKKKAELIYIENREICIKLDDNTEFRFSASNNKKLSTATDEQLSNVELICNGTGIHWEDIDEDLSVSGVLAGRFG